MEHGESRAEPRREQRCACRGSTTALPPVCRGARPCGRQRAISGEWHGAGREERLIEEETRQAPLVRSHLLIVESSGAGAASSPAEPQPCLRSWGERRERGDGPTDLLLAGDGRAPAPGLQPSWRSLLPLRSGALRPCRRFSPEGRAALLQPCRDSEGTACQAAPWGGEGRGSGPQAPAAAAAPIGTASPARPELRRLPALPGSQPRGTAELPLLPAAHPGLGLARAAQGEAKPPRAELQPQQPRRVWRGQPWPLCLPSVPPWRRLHVAPAGGNPPGSGPTVEVGVCSHPVPGRGLPWGAWAWQGHPALLWWQMAGCAAAGMLFTICWV